MGRPERERRSAPREGPPVGAVSKPALADDLGRGIAALGLAIRPNAQAQLLAYIALLAKWNGTYNLTAIREPERMVTHHLLDALAVLPHLPQRAGLRVLDVGAGAGIPGIALAIARPDWRLTLVDAVDKKAAFMTQAAIELALPNVDAHAARVEDFVADAPYDVVISRAFSDLATFAATSARHLAPQGLLVAMKGALPGDEIAALPATLRVLATPALEVPGLGAARHLVVMRRADGATT